MKEDFNFTIVFVCPSRGGGGSKKSKRSESCHNIVVHLPPSHFSSSLSSPKCRIQVTATERGARATTICTHSQHAGDDCFFSIGPPGERTASLFPRQEFDIFAMGSVNVVTAF